MSNQEYARNMSGPSNSAGGIDWLNEGDDFGEFDIPEGNHANHHARNQQSSKGSHNSSANKDLSSQNQSKLSESDKQSRANPKYSNGSSDEKSLAARQQMINSVDSPPKQITKESASISKVDGQYALTSSDKSSTNDSKRYHRSRDSADDHYQSHSSSSSYKDSKDKRYNAADKRQPNQDRNRSELEKDKRPRDKDEQDCDKLSSYSNIPESELKVHFTVTRLNVKDFDNPQIKTQFQEALVQEFSKVVSKATKSASSRTVHMATVEFDSKSQSGFIELKIGFRYDHQAFILFQNVDQVKFPKIGRIDTQDMKILSSRAFTSYMQTNKDELVKMASEATKQNSSSKHSSRSQDRIRRHDNSSRQDSTKYDNRKTQRVSPGRGQKYNLQESQLNRDSNGRRKSRSRSPIKKEAPKERTSSRPSSKDRRTKHYDNSKKDEDSKKPADTLDDKKQQLEQRAKQPPRKEEVPKVEIPAVAIVDDTKSKQDSSVSSKSIEQEQVKHKSECCCYIIGFPRDKKGSDIIDEFNKRNIQPANDYELKVQRDSFGFECTYIKLIYENPAFVNACLEQPIIKFSKQNAFIVPDISNVPIEVIIAHHQLVFTFKNDSDFNEAAKFCSKALEDITDIRREIIQLHNFFSEMGDIVDLNLDYFPDMICLTFANHSSVLSALIKQTFTYKTSFQNEWTFTAKKIDFMLPVRNSNFTDDSPPSKYLPIYLLKEKMQQYISQQQKTSNSTSQTAQNQIASY